MGGNFQHRFEFGTEAHAVFNEKIRVSTKDAKFHAKIIPRPCERRAWTCEHFCIKRSKSEQSRPRKEGGMNGFRRTWAILARPSVWFCSSLLILVHPCSFLPIPPALTCQDWGRSKWHSSILSLSVRLSPHLDPISNHLTISLH